MTTKRTLTDAERAEARALIVAFCSSGVYRIAGSADRMSDDALASWLDVRDEVAEPLLAKLGEAFLELDRIATAHANLGVKLVRVCAEATAIRAERDALRSLVVRIKDALGLHGNVPGSTIVSRIKRLAAPVPRTEVRSDILDHLLRGRRD